MNSKAIGILLIVAVGFPSVNWAGETKMFLYKEFQDSDARFRKAPPATKPLTQKMASIIQIFGK